MATASPSAKPSHLICPICEERYNERDHLPKGFPCQHSVCMRCLEGMIKRCDGDEVACPLCRQTVPIPKSKADGFPSNVAILDMLRVAQSQVEVVPSTCTLHNKAISAFCSTCQEEICVSCMLKSPKHKGHDIEELSEAMERCIHQSKDLLKDIIQTASTIQENIQQKAQSNSPQCLQLLCQMQKCKQYVGNTASGGIEDKGNISTYMPNKISADNPGKQASAPAPLDILPAATLPQSVNKEKMELLATAKLPEFKYLDMNRRNRLLLTFPQSSCAVYKIKHQKFCTMEQSALSDKTVTMLKDAEHAILSQDSKLVVQDEFSMMYCNKAYSFGKRYMCKVHVFEGDWMAVSHRKDSGLVCEFMQEKDETSIHKETISLDSLVSISLQCMHFIAK